MQQPEDPQAFFLTNQQNEANCLIHTLIKNIQFNDKSHPMHG